MKCSLVPCITMSSAGYVRVTCSYDYVFRFISCLQMVCLNVWLSTIGMPGTHGDQKRALDLPELELQRTVSCHVHAGNGRGSSTSAHTH